MSDYQDNVRRHRASLYHDAIVKATGCHPETARLVEAWMRLADGVLDGLSPTQFKEEARVGYELALAEPAHSDALARSYGL